MSEVIDMKKLKWELRKRKIQDRAVALYHRTEKFVVENKELLTVGIPAMAVITKNVTHTVTKLTHNRNLKLDERAKSSRWYDPSLGHYWYTKRPLSSSEQLAVKRRRDAGEKLGDILESMKLLK